MSAIFNCGSLILNSNFFVSVFHSERRLILTKKLLRKCSRRELLYMKLSRRSSPLSSVASSLKVLLQMSLVLVIGARRPVIRIGRFAGQYAKPRSANLETRGGVSLPSYRGDNINRPEFTAEARRPDPQLLLRGYERASMTLNFVRALVKGGFADLHHPEYFDLDWAKDSPLAHEYHRMVQTIKDSLQFVENVLGVRAGDTDKIDFFTAHEALHLG